ncbi:MAG: hypothetical protein J6S50_00425 [Oscillospiraceae bacterium]|nr:hypothetical protein [Oscillospiraceae bacterium]MBO7726966.1 hypothetical protein [Oscillospiraceae bacterium]
MSCWTAETEKIIKAHQGDFTSANWQTKLNWYGGYSAYLNILGGVFKKYNGKNASVKTAAQFQEVAQYVMGLMAIYGFNYNNGQTHVLWGGPKPFYPSKDSGRCNWGEIDTLCSSSGKDKTTNCNFGMDSFYYKCGLMPKYMELSDMFKWQARHYKVIRKKEDLKIGDLIHLFHSHITSNDPGTWSGWGHVCCVGEKRGNTIIAYDTGRRFISSGDFKKEFNVNSKNEPIGEYDNYDGWVGIHFVELSGNNGEVKGDSDLAVEVIAGKYGSGPMRAVKLGKRYDAVQKRVNYFLGGSSAGRAAYLRAAAGYVLKGYAGTDEERRKFFGKDYAAVQDKVNWVIRTARDVIANKYGKADDRKAALGIDYDLVQQQVNRMV